MQKTPSQPWTIPHAASGRTTPKLLVSVKNATEAALARDGGVDWIDLKSPSAGPLGAPTRDQAAQVAEALQDFPDKSVALGEFADLEWQLARDLTQGFPVAKVGMSGVATRSEAAAQHMDDRHWSVDFRRLSAFLLPTRLIPVLYADFPSCQAPPPRAMLELAQQTCSPFLLIDTFRKDGRTTLDWLPLEQLRSIVQDAAEADIRVVIAGSLRESDLDAVWSCRPWAIAVRGAVCAGSRTDSLNPERLQAWVTRFARTAGG